MNAWSHDRHAGGFLAIAVARVERWLLEPAPAGPTSSARAPEPSTGGAAGRRGRRARAALRRHDGRSWRSRSSSRSAIAQARRSSRRARAAGGARAGDGCRAPAGAALPRRGRGRRRAPVPARPRRPGACASSPSGGPRRWCSTSSTARPPRRPLALADAAVLVAGPGVEPALADVVAASLARDGCRRPLSSLNRVDRARTVGATGRVLAIGEVASRRAAGARRAATRRRRSREPIAELADRLWGSRAVTRRRCERGQASVLLLGVVAAAVLAGALILAAFGQAYGARGHAQRVADLAAIAGGAGRCATTYPRLFEPVFLDAESRTRAICSTARTSRSRARAAVQGAQRNGGAVRAGDVGFPDAASFAPTRVRVRVRDRASRARRRGGRRPP